MSQERERERRYRNLLAFSLLEVLIVIAIIAILSTLIVIRWRDMKKNEEIRQCRANILEIAAWMEAYKTSNDFYPGKDKNGKYIGDVYKSNSYRCIGYNTDEIGQHFINFPVVRCPLGDVSLYTTAHVWTQYSYGLRSRYNEYTIRCMVHNNSTTTLYEHIQGRPAGFRSEL
ncbi:prepilin-type N-terminal cleavage/methylation domain-containing protein [bacterium]|nr:prepilin-type N-terminal cleavage/methylation domain-containing protein [bacterium]